MDQNTLARILTKSWQNELKSLSAENKAKVNLYIKIHEALQRFKYGLIDFKELETILNNL